LPAFFAVLNMPTKKRKLSVLARSLSFMYTGTKTTTARSLIEPRQTNH
jgi:hypothetical protein